MYLSPNPCSCEEIADERPKAPFRDHKKRLEVETAPAPAQNHEANHPTNDDEHRNMQKPNAEMSMV